MTLIIGVKCTDGIVMGADGAATTAVMGERTMLQPISRKLEILEGKIIFSISGPVGLGQRLKGEVHKAWEEDKFSNKKPFEVMTILREVMWKHVQYEFSVASVTQPMLGGIALQNVLCQTLIAMPVKHNPCLFQFDQHCAPEEATNDLPFISIGSGQKIADPFLAFLKRIFWKDKAPTLSEGIFATLWALNHTIKVNPGGVSEPKQIVVIEKKNGDCIARELSKEELQEHDEYIDSAEDSLSNFRNNTKDMKTEKEIKIPEPS